MGEDGHGVGSALGERIRRARLAHRPALRLIDLAGDELTAGMLSKIERGRVTPSLATLAYLARRLDLRPGALLDGIPARPAGLPRPWAALGDARAALWLGDPAGAGRRAQALLAATVGARQTGPSTQPTGGSPTGGPGAGSPPPGRPQGADGTDGTDETDGTDGTGGADGQDGTDRSILMAAALGLAAEAGLERGNAQDAARQVNAASVALGACPAAHRSAAGTEAYLAWLLGLLERRRGQPLLAERSWSRCLDFLEEARRVGPLGLAESVLNARVLLNLGELRETTGATQTALNFLVRAAAALVALADPAVVARDRLQRQETVQRDEAGEGSSGGANDGASDGPESAETGAALLAAVAFAGRLAEQVNQNLARLDRAALRRPAGPPPEVSHSRHLR